MCFALLSATTYGSKVESTNDLRVYWLASTLYYFRVADMTRKSQAMDDEILMDASTISSPIRVISFDLDNCLWRTNACIDAANDALAKHLEKDNIKQPQRVEIVMGRLFKKSPINTYCPLAVGDSSDEKGNGSSSSSSPVLLTKLRIDAIKEILIKHNDYHPDDATKYATEAFDLWTTERHNAIPINLATSVASTLEKLKSTICIDKNSQPVIIGAITDGNSDPRNVPELRDLFDFCVNAEEGKLHRTVRVYSILKHSPLRKLTEFFSLLPFSRCFKT